MDLEIVGQAIPTHIMQVRYVENELDSQWVGLAETKYLKKSNQNGRVFFFFFGVLKVIEKLPLWSA